MAGRIRSIKPEFWRSEDVVALPVPARLTFIGLWTYVDDFGNGNANPKVVKATVWPLDDDVTPEAIRGHIDLLVAGGQVDIYEANGRQYLSISNWEKHQKVDRPSRSNIPAPEEVLDVIATGSRTVREGFATTSRRMFAPKAQNPEIPPREAFASGTGAHSR
ncbi:MAG: hypothetical protein EPO52_17235 [Herbiconiux sp.]|uniref:hypothetical protein n=1 Tax=Herbiconiux sp. TaxID=1871186 RepID=UPI0011F88656|nr:hypothetical protein [Herbiconiux sp.]TAJ46281.1 MAG: hypothetical protein EPO52_17235 [Herbiconiux sp.]